MDFAQETGDIHLIEAILAAQSSGYDTSQMGSPVASSPWGMNSSSECSTAIACHGGHCDSASTKDLYHSSYVNFPEGDYSDSGHTSPMEAFKSQDNLIALENSDQAEIELNPLEDMKSAKYIASMSRKSKSWTAGHMPRQSDISTMTHSNDNSNSNSSNSNNSQPQIQSSDELQADAVRKQKFGRSFRKMASRMMSVIAPSHFPRSRAAAAAAARKASTET